MKQWVVVEQSDDGIEGIYGPFDHEGLADAFATAYSLTRQDRGVYVMQLNDTLETGK